MEKNLSLHPTRIGLLFILLLIAGNNTHADNVPLKGYWKDTRSISQEVPISADFTDGILTILNPAMSSDITVTIVKEGNNIYTNSISAADSAETHISVDTLPSGTYVLEIRNHRGGYLYGIFTK